MPGTLIANLSTTQEQDGKERIVQEAPYLKFPIKEKAFGTFVKTMEEKSNEHWDKVELKKRQEKSRDYWLGKQLEDAKLYRWQTPYIDNMIFRNTETIISNALGRLPDIIVVPGGKGPNSKDIAKKLQQVLEIKLKSNEMRHILRMSARHLFTHLIGCIKYRWDETIGKDGDYIFEWVHPDNLLLDGTTYLDQNPRIIIHYLEKTIKELQSIFPNKKEEIWKRFNIKRGTEKQLNTIIRYKETWFTWYDSEGKPVEGVGWNYDENLVFDTMKNQNWDYEGEERETGEMEVDVETGQEVPITEEFHHNHFDKQEKPFILLNFLNLGKHLIDDTSLIEQNLYMQDNVNKRGRQITDKATTANGKLVLSSDYITKKEAERINDDPGEHLWGKGRVQDGVTRLKGEGPSATLFAAQNGDRQVIDAGFGTHPTLRGEKETDVATTSSLLREGDVTRIDDFVEEALTRAMDRVVKASVHMMKVNYTALHFINDSGTDGEDLFIEMDQDRIEDGVVVKVKASTSDQRIQRAEAIELSKARMIDPLSLYEKTGEANPKEMTKRLILFTINPLAYLQEIMGEGGMPQELIDQLNAGAGEGGGVDPQAIQDIQLLQQGETPTPPQPITVEYLAGLANFMESPDYANMSPDLQALFADYLNQVNELAKTNGGQAPAGPVV